MNRMKKVQILLVVAAVLCAIGIVASLVGGGDEMPRNYRPPWWIEWLAFIPLVARSKVGGTATIVDRVVILPARREE